HRYIPDKSAHKGNKQNKKQHAAKNAPPALERMQKKRQAALFYEFDFAARSERNFVQAFIRAYTASCGKHTVFGGDIFDIYFFMIAAVDKTVCKTAGKRKNHITEKPVK